MHISAEQAKAYLKRVYTSWVGYLGLIVVLVISNQFLSWILRTSDRVYVVPNTFVFGLQANMVVITAIILFMTYGLVALKCVQQYPLSSLLILAGGWSNYLERLFNGQVTDYIPFMDGYINIADIVIWIGLVWLFINVWFASQQINNFNGQHQRLYHN